MLIGTNLEGVFDYCQSLPFANLMKQARAFEWKDTKTQTGPLPVDQFGWPTAGPSKIYLTTQGTLTVLNGSLANDFTGTYKFRYTGDAKMIAYASAIRVKTSVYDPVTNKTTGEAFIDPANPINKQAQICVAFDKPVKDLEFMLPGHEFGELWNKNFLKNLDPYFIFRFMDMQATNHNETTGLKDRTLPEHASQARTVVGQFKTYQTGVCLEYLIDLCNTTKKNGWFCIPIQADDEYVRYFFQLVKDKLDPSLVIYVELANEIWNARFQQFHMNLALAQQDYTNNIGNYNFNGKVDLNQMWMCRQARRTVNIAQIANEVIPGSLNKRVRMVLANQSGAKMFTQRFPIMLEYIKAIYGNPADYIFTLALAPYANTGNYVNDRTLMPPDILKLLDTGNDWVGTNVKLCSDIAAQYKLIGGYSCYEGTLETGELSKLNTETDTLFNEVISRRVQAILMPECKDVMNRYLKRLNDNGCKLFMQFQHMSGYSRRGTYGAMPRNDMVDAPRYVAIKEYPQKEDYVWLSPAEIKLLEIKTQLTTLKTQLQDILDKLS
jgi:hypothetical protein